MTGDASPVGIRGMTEEDLPEVAEIEREAFGAHPRSTAMTVDDLRTELVRSWSRALVAGSLGRITGFLLAWHVADELHVLNVAVKREERRRGLARKLLAELFGYARAADVRAMYLEVRTKNRPAIELYRVHGFYAINVRRGYYADGEDALEMRLDLDPHGGIVLKPDLVPIPEPAPEPKA